MFLSKHVTVFLSCQKMGVCTESPFAAQNLVYILARFQNTCVYVFIQCKFSGIDKWKKKDLDMANRMV
jgi:hypothetical protein